MNSSDFRLVRLIPTTGTGSFSGGGGSYWDSAGVLKTAPPNTLRLTYDLSDLRKAPYALLEPAATNSIRNNTMVGAVVGSPGTLPANWNLSLASGLQREVIAVSSESGIDYLDIRVFGAAAASGQINLSFESATVISAMVGQIWASSIYCTSPNGWPMSFRMTIDQVSSGGGFVAGGPEKAFVPGSTALNINRFSTITAAISNVNTAYVRPVLYAPIAAGDNVDVTLRIGLPQLERDRVTSPIKTTNAAVTRAADVVGAGAGLVQSNVPITEPLWAAGTYGLGARVRDAHNFVFESLVASNAAALTDKTKWLPLGLTNRLKVFDKAVNSQTSAPGMLTFSVKPGVVATTLMLINMAGASVTVSQSDSGYVKTKNLVSHEVDNWYDFYCEEPVRAGDAVFTDIPPYPNSMLTVAIDNGPLESKIGACLVGKPLTLGKVTASFSAGVLSYSTSTTDTFGNITMVKRYNAPRMNFEVMIPAGSEDFAYRVLRDYTDTEIGIIVGDRFGMGIGYGYLGQWDVPKSGSGRTAPIEFKGLV